MVKERLKVIKSGDGENADSLGKAIGELPPLSLRKIKTPEAIMKICHEVINAVEKSLLVSVNEGALETRKLKKKTNDERLQYTEYEANKNGADIRRDWSTNRWEEKNPPHGWVYHDTDGTLLGTIYETKEERGYALFIQREIANNPHGAFLLIENMKNKLGKLMRNKEKNGGKKPEKTLGTK